MADPWLTLIGLGEDGPAGLSTASREALARAAVIFGGPRHLALVEAGDRGQAWPVPFDVAPVLALRGRAVHCGDERDHPDCRRLGGLPGQPV